jgi:hypothetical protein
MRRGFIPVYCLMTANLVKSDFLLEFITHPQFKDTSLANVQLLRCSELQWLRLTLSVFRELSRTSALCVLKAASRCEQIGFVQSRSRLMISGVTSLSLSNHHKTTHCPRNNVIKFDVSFLPNTAVNLSHLTKH